MVLCVHFSFSMLWFCLAWAWASLDYSVTVSVSQLPFVWKMLFPWNDTKTLDRSLNDQVFLSVLLDFRKTLRTGRWSHPASVCKAFKRPAGDRSYPRKLSLLHSTEEPGSGIFWLYYNRSLRTKFICTFRPEVLFWLWSHVWKAWVSSLISSSPCLTRERPAYGTVKVKREPPFWFIMQGTVGLSS